MTQKLQEAFVQGLDRLYGAAASYSEREDWNRGQQGQKRRLAAATAASVIGASLDRLSTAGNASDGTTDDEDSMLFWNEEVCDELSEQQRSQEKKMARQQNHFLDILLEKLLFHAIPGTLPDKEEFENRINDPIRKDTERLSVPKFVSNLRKSTAKLGGMFQAQYFVLRIFHWTQPSLTLLALVIYSLVVLNPSILFMLPLLLLLYGAMVPGYVYRHPINKPELVHVRERGDSLLDKFFRLHEGKDLDRFIEEDSFEQNMIDRVPEVDDATDSGSKLLKKNMEFFVNMRDLQNVMSKGLKLHDKAENFWYGTAGFKDERHSTSLFFTVFTSTFFFIVIGPYIPWRFILITSGWALLIVIHPKVIPKVKKLNETLKPRKKELDKMVKESERQDIVIDEAPEVRQLELFEIWKKSLTSSTWEFYMFSNSVFDQTDFYRRSQRPPPGVTDLSEVACPKTWRFDDESWNIDYNCKRWFYNRGLRLNGPLHIDSNNEFFVDQEFKRRRLYRNAIRYSKPARKPPHLL